MSSQRALSYQYDEFMRYQVVNNKLPQHLVAYCVQEANNNVPDISSFDEQLNEIISSITKGDNPNNIVFKNYVKYFVNMINQTNYAEYLQKLKQLDFTLKENVHFLASELIVCAIRCPISVKGFTFTEDVKYKSVPEICADIAKQFSSFIIKTDDKDISFHEEIMKICQQYFLDFVDINKSMDEHNENTSDNFKGFMTFMGLLYSRGIINIKIVIDCLDTIKHAIFSSVCTYQEHDAITGKHSCLTHSDKLMGFKKQLDTKLMRSICYYDCNKCTKPSEDEKLITYRKHIECTNLHKGYEHLLTHVVHSLELKTVELTKSLAEKELILKNVEGLLQNVKDKTKTKELRLYIESCSDITDLADFEKIKVVLDKEYDNSKESHASLLTTLDKIGEYLDIIIKMHQEIVCLNLCYRSMNKNQLTAPFRPFSIINHNSLGANLNKLYLRLSTYNKKYTTKYIPVTLTKTIV